MLLFLPLLGGLIGGAGGAGGSIASSIMQKEMAREQMRFQALMSSTAHQRAVIDMKAAGLNPILAAGNPASSPGGAGANLPDIGAAINSGAQSGKQVAMANQEIKNLRATEGLTGASAGRERQATQNLQVTEKLIAHQAQIAERGAVKAGIEAKFYERLDKLIEDNGWYKNPEKIPDDLWKMLFEQTRPGVLEDMNSGIDALNDWFDEMGVRLRERLDKNTARDPRRSKMKVGKR